MKSHKPSAKRIVATASGMVLLIVLIVASALLVTSNAHSGGPPVDPLAHLNRATVMSNPATTEAADQADEDAQATARSIVLSSPYSNTKVLYSTPPPEPIETQEAESIPVPTGISSLQQDPTDYKMIYSFTHNMWLGVVNGNMVNVLAGLKWDEPGGGFFSRPGQGMVLVGVNSEKGKEYLTPVRAGEVKLTASSSTCLTLVTVTDEGTPTGTTFYFDVATMQWSCL